MYSRGKQMELSDPSEFNLQKLISWLHQNLPALTNLERLKKQRRASSNVRQGISVWNAKSDKQQSFDLTSNIEKTAQTDAGSKYYTENQVGKSVFHIQRPTVQSQALISPALSSHQDLKKEMGDSLNDAIKKTSVRNKIIQSMNKLETTLDEIRKQEGLVAQMRAQKRLRDNNNAARMKEEKLAAAQKEKNLS